MLLAPSGDELAAGAAACPLGTKECSDSCVPLDNPATGCALWDCEPCDLPRAAVSCHAGACAVDVCESGFADCDGLAASGCEIPLPPGVQGCGCQSIRFVDEFGLLVIDTSPAEPIELGNGNFTVEAWVMLPAEAPSPEGSGVFASSTRERPGEPQPLPIFMLSADSTSLFCRSFAGEVDQDKNALVIEGVLQPNRWTHVSCVRDGDRLVGYVDGVEHVRVPYDIDGIELDHPAIGGESGNTLAGLRLGPTRISRVARYQADFTPTTHWVVDDDTLLQFLVFSPYAQMNAFSGRIQDESGSDLFAVSRGGVERGTLTPCDESE